MTGDVYGGVAMLALVSKRRSQRLTPPRIPAPRSPARSSRRRRRSAMEHAKSRAFGHGRAERAQNRSKNKPSYAAV